ncbi:MAG: hypothetical protein Q4G25_13460 [Paracoccus sp. (in: a-proteobacteria)]|nr:hypothetical protein [Paracoccus sp. (in: a-proteobacteria)]
MTAIRAILLSAATLAVLSACDRWRDPEIGLTPERTGPHVLPLVAGGGCGAGTAAGLLAVALDQAGAKIARLPGVSTTTCGAHQAR